MTHASSEVLKDCLIALTLLEEEKNLERWRVHWAGAVALLRTVGHVLEKIDGKDVHFKAAIKAAYEGWKSDRERHAVFWEFIVAERNNILKEYRFNLHPNEEVGIAFNLKLVDPTTGEPLEISDAAFLNENIYRPAMDAFREYDDVRDIYRDAVEWWAKELDKIEIAAGKP